MTGFPRRRRRARHEPSPAPRTPTPADIAPDGPHAATPAVADPPPDAYAAPDDREAERGLRGLVGPGSSQVGVPAAMRARDAARPTADDIAGAEAELVIVRRNWVPRDQLTKGPR